MLGKARGGGLFSAKIAIARRHAAPPPVIRVNGSQRTPRLQPASAGFLSEPERAGRIAPSFTAGNRSPPTFFQPASAGLPQPALATAGAKRLTERPAF